MTRHRKAGPHNSGDAPENPRIMRLYSEMMHVFDQIVVGEITPRQYLEKAQGVLDRLRRELEDEA